VSNPEVIMLSDEEMAKIDQLQTDFKYKGYGIGSGFGDSARLRKKSVEGGGREWDLADLLYSTMNTDSRLP